MARSAWRLDTTKGTSEHLTRPARLSLNSIAKGYIIGRACDAGVQPGTRHSGCPAEHRRRRPRRRRRRPDGRCRSAGRRLGDGRADRPRQVRDRSVATSGSSQRGFRIGGKWYSHIFDPRTGQPAGRVMGATVITERTADANALATTLNVLPVEDGLRLAASIPGVRVSRRHGRRANLQERRLVRLRATVDRARRPGDAGRPGPGFKDRPRAARGATRMRCGSTSRSPARRRIPDATDALTSPSGSRTRADSRARTLALWLQNAAARPALAPRPEALVSR